ncbi:type II secretion system protein [bacterium]|nr:type II secretion system protein [bacterium]
MKKSARGFTLIELIFVMATISVLFGMITPMFRNMREKGRTIICLNNVRNISEAFMTYSSENGGRLPLCGWYCEDGFHGKRRGNHGVGKPWMDVLVTYLNDNKNMFICPSDENPEDYNFHCHGSSGSYNRDGWYSYPMDKRTKFTACSYSANEDVIGIDNRYNTYNAGGGASTYGGRIGGDLTKMQRSPSCTVLICDGHHIYINSQKIRDMQDAEKIDADYTMDRAVFNHIAGIAVGFCDGRAQWVKKGRFSTLNIDPNTYGE